MRVPILHPNERLCGATTYRLRLAPISVGRSGVSSMSIAPEVPARPHIVVVGNHKGGSGKSTVAMHIIVALLKAGKRIASFDLDLTQQTLTHYIENRWAWGRQNDLP